MNRTLFRLFAIVFLLTSSVLNPGCKKDDSVSDPGSQENLKVKFWLTSPGQNILFAEQQVISPSSATSGLDLITINSSQTYQTMDGFGYALTGGSAMHLFKMGAAERKQILTELFSTNDKNIGVSYLRVSIGASDLDEKVFSYDDLPAGETDVDMQKFSLAEDRKNVIPVLKEILSINPDIKILGSPWSAPLWMKTTKSSIGGSLRSEYFDAYAKYFVRYIEEMKKEGITIDAITVQNEPLHPGNNPSMLMPAQDQAAFIKNSLGPAFKNAGLQTKIIIYDHNADNTDYAISILDDQEAGKYVDGSAFHLYGGDINNLSRVYTKHPEKNLYYTEMWVGGGSNFADNLKWHTKELTIGASRNWCKTVLEWNLAADQDYKPHTDGGCDRCLGAITIQGNQVTRNSAYYITAHASKFVRPGAKRIESNMPADLPNVAFQTPSGSIVVIVLNNTGAKKYFNIKVGDKVILGNLAQGAVGTYIW